MMRPARRDGTPDRDRNPRAGGNDRARAGRPHGRKPARDAQPGRPARGEHGGNSGEGRQRGRTGGSPQQGGHPARKPARAGRPGAPGKSGAGRGGAYKGGTAKGNASKGNASKGAAGRGAAGKAGAQRKPKPTRAKREPEMLSFARPARNQSDGPAATSFSGSSGGSGEGVRLQKVLAQAGVASRRAAEILIDRGRVEVDGQIVTRQGMRIDPTESVVRVDGARIVIDQDMVYLALNKPRGWQSTMSDDLGRPCIGDIVAERVMAGQRIFHVGRLDAETEGLILLTNDGELAHRLMHPSYEILKTYLATLDGRIPRNLGRILSDGVELEDGPVHVDKFSVVDLGETRTMVRVVLHEGRKHIVRRLFAEVDHPVLELVRTDVGPVSLGDQRPGTLRVLRGAEVAELYAKVGM
nr:pseudouridine synthase [Tomitella gaofuii]